LNGEAGKEHAMSAEAKQAKEIFLAAVDKATPAERAAYLDQACSGDPALRQRVEGLLQAHDEPGTFLRGARAPIGTASASPAEVAVDALTEGEGRLNSAAVLLEEVGDRVGPYKLVQKLGEGGMGIVWVAEQTEPVKRRVALKVIKPGLASTQVLRRFEIERQALALMDHSSIAKVFDAGATPDGRPYFVMELVQGVPITKYCDELLLSVRERLELFADVCRAIQHAHQKGVIHRDVKPSNVLVCIQDGKPVAKVIDFGVAKALNQQLGEESLYTEVGAIVGTLEYMSPEQAEMSPLGVDTRADIYALGVLLYELLTGLTPLDKQKLRRAAYTEMVRLIKEEVPSKPSTRLTESKENLASVAALRRTEPGRLAKELKGDLDWIVMKALEKDRTRRYDGASSFANDIERFLHDEPVEACPPSAAYRLSKFIHRNKGPVLAAASLLLLLVAGVIGTTWGLIKADRALHATNMAREQEAEQRRIAESNEQKANAAVIAEREAKERADRARNESVQAQKAETEQRKRAEANEQKAITAAAAEKQAKETAQARAAETQSVLNFVETKVFAAARPQGQSGGLGKDVTMRQAIEAALPAVEGSFSNQPLIEARLRMTLGDSFRYLGDSHSAVNQFEKARALYTKQRGVDDPDTLLSMNKLGNCYADVGRQQEALKLRRETLERRKALLGADHPDTLNSMNNLANSYFNLGQSMEAVKLCEEVLALRKAKLGPDHLDTIDSVNNLGATYYRVGRFTDALRLFEEALALERVKLGPDDLRTLLAMENVALLYGKVGRNLDAANLLEQILGIYRSKLGADHPSTLDAMEDLATCYTDLGRHAEAMKLTEQTLAGRKVKLGPRHLKTLRSMNNLAESYAAQGRYLDALKLGEESLVLHKAILGPDSPDTLRSMSSVADFYGDVARHADAVKLHQQTLDLRKTKLGADHPETLISMSHLAANLTKMDRDAEALALIEECLKRASGRDSDAGLVPTVMNQRLRHFEKAKDAAGCRATAEMWEKLKRADSASLYTAACFRAITASMLRSTKSDTAAKEATNEADQAMAWLKQAVAAGYKDGATLKKDKDLSSLRDREDFKKLVGEVESKQGKDLKPM
jgi:serine/threonine protein kinase/tetratricopeptide (TPR) repeat protein